MGPLDGMRVMDLSRYGPGRYCAMILGDLGADVITVEAPQRTSKMHNLMTDDLSFRHIGQNRNKRSIAVDLKKPEGKSIIYRLAKKTDVIIETFRPGVVKRLEVDYETLRKINPQIVYCSLTGYGQDGPYSQRPGHDINFAAVAGILGLSGQRDRDPFHLPFQLGDVASISHASIAILSALLARDKIGKGQYIDTSMVDGLVFHLWHYAMMFFQHGQPPERPSLPTGSDMAWMNVYKCKDGKHITLACMEPTLWANTCRALDREDLIALQYSPMDEQLRIYEELSNIFATKNRDEWVKLADTNDVPIAPVYTLDETFSDPHIEHRKAIVEMDHPKLGKIKVLNTPFKLSETPAEIRTRPPLWAEHTQEVLSTLLGYSVEEIDRLLQAKVIE